MQSFRQHRGIAAHLPQRNVDTDQIIPARFLHLPRAAGYGAHVFNDLRGAGFVLDTPPFDAASILIAGDNFGCGSSREHAVWALLDAGIRVVIAPGFGDIFAGNALQNGLLAVALPADRVATLAEAATARAPLELEVDLEAQRIGGPGIDTAFDIAPRRKQALLLGLSEIEMTLRDIDAVRAHEARRAAAAPWLQSPPQATPQTAPQTAAAPRHTT